MRAAAGRLSGSTREELAAAGNEPLRRFGYADRMTLVQQALAANDSLKRIKCSVPAPKICVAGNGIIAVGFASSTRGERRSLVRAKLAAAPGSWAKLILAIKQSPGWVTNGAFSPDGARIACTNSTGAASSYMLIADASTGKEVGNVALCDAYTWAVGYSPDGKTIATGGWDGIVRIWNAATLTAIRTHRVPVDPSEPKSARIESVSYSPDGRWLAATCHDGRVHMWSNDIGHQVRSGSSAAVSGTSSSPITAGAAGEPSPKSVATDELPARTLLVGPNDVPWNIAWDPRGRWMATPVKFWDMKTGQELFTIDRPTRQSAVSPDGSRIASAGINPHVLVWDVATRQLAVTLAGQRDSAYVGFSPDGTRLVTLGRWNVEIWDAISGSRLFELGEPRDESRNQDFSRWVSFSPDGRRIAALGRGVLRIWSATESTSFTGPDALAERLPTASSGARSEPFAKHGNETSESADAEFITTRVGSIKLKRIPAGTFLMGSTDDDKDASDNEKPQHRVRITRPFYLGVHEVTRGQFGRFVDETGYKTEGEKDGKGGWGWNDKTTRYERTPASRGEDPASTRPTTTPS